VFLAHSFTATAQGCLVNSYLGRRKGRRVYGFFCWQSGAYKEEAA
jgi:hypothetical protein